MAGWARLVRAACVVSLPVVVAAAAVPAVAAASTTQDQAGAAAANVTGSHRGDVVFVEAGDLYFDSHSTGVVRRLTWGAGRDDPAFSPNGTQIAYDRAGDIWVLTIGAGSRQVTHVGKASQPAWSPDGRTLAYAQVVGPGDSEIFQIPVAGGAAVRLTWTASAGCSASQPAWQGARGWLTTSAATPAAAPVRRGSSGARSAPLAS